MMYANVRNVSNFSLMATLLWLQCGASAANDYGNATLQSASQLRFRDFEPRYDRAQLPSHTRQSRGFHFHASDDDLSVELEFIVPFFKIPVQRSMSVARDAMRGIFNLQTGALLNAVVIVSGAAIMAAIIKFLSTILTAGSYAYRSERTNAYNKRVRSLTSVLESKFVEHNIDMPACIQRYICAYLRGSNIGTNGYTPPVIASLASLELLRVYLNGTAVFDAIEAAKDVRRDCAQIFRTCSWPKRQLQPLKALSRYLHIFNG